MKKLKHENELVKEAIRAGMRYGEERGVVEFEATDSAHEISTGCWCMTR